MGGGTSPGATRENGRARTAQHQQPKGSKSDGADNKETAMATSEMRITVSLAWWWQPYLYGIATMVFLTGMQPDMEKVQRVIRRAIRVKVV